MILVTEWLASPGPELLAASGQAVRYEPTLWRDAPRLRELLPQAEALIVRNQTRVTASLLETAPRLRVVGRLGVGLDNIEVEALRARGIALVTASQANAIAVAEYVLAAMLHVARNLAAADASVRAGQWERTRLGGTELWGRTLGLVGVGEIGRRVARRAAAFGMTVLGYDPFVGPYDYAPTELGIAMLPLAEVLARADFVSIHVPLLPTTYHLFDAERLAQMRPQAVLINSARGGIVDEQALVEALSAGHLRYAVLDVTEQEPLPADSPLRASSAVLLTPHIAGLTAEAQERTSRLVVTEVLRLLAEGKTEAAP
ncbi:hydroxyacid dehydrogenase [Thermogemmatispora sp.]|uniref:hydroxyacid dehydrogenase n=1 Tax=Thermogemmatispora sp. TaxID=1968838 RepID=UPI0035E433E1